MFKKIVRLLGASNTEYRANISGLHSFFGTVLGLVLVGTEQLSNDEFFFIMGGLGLIVVSILNISTPNRRIAYTATAFFGTLALQPFATAITGRPNALSEKIDITLILWICTTMSVEFFAGPNGLQRFIQRQSATAKEGG